MTILSHRALLNLSLLALLTLVIAGAGVAGYALGRWTAPHHVAVETWIPSPETVTIARDPDPEHNGEVLVFVAGQLEWRLKADGLPIYDRDVERGNRARPHPG